jgi:hypothetical protein
MCITKYSYVYVDVYLSPYDKFNYQYSVLTKNPSLELKIFVISKIRQKLYYEHTIGIRPIWYLWFNNTYYFKEENIYIKIRYNYLM